MVGIGKLQETRRLVGSVAVDRAGQEGRLVGDHRHRLAAQAPERGRMDLRSYGVGAQILRECGVQRMQLLGKPRRLPSLAGGFGLEVAGYITKD